MTSIKVWEIFNLNGDFSVAAGYSPKKLTSNKEFLSCPLLITPGVSRVNILGFGGYTVATAQQAYFISPCCADGIFLAYWRLWQPCVSEGCRVTDLLHRTVKLWIQRKRSWRKLKCYSSEYVNDEPAKQPYCWYGESFSGLDRRLNQTPHSLKPKPNPEPEPVPNSLQFSEARERRGNCRRKVWSWQRCSMTLKERCHLLHNIKVQGEAASYPEEI